MASVQEAAPPGERLARTAVVEPAVNKLRPVKLWAVVGVLFLIVEAIAIGGWLTSDGFTRTPAGPDPLPGYMNFFVRFWEIGGLFFGAIFLYFFMIRPWRREGHITLDGLLCIVFISAYWQDTLDNFFQPWFVYNSAFLNFGAWDPYILGWLSPNSGVMPEPIVWDMPLYLYFCFGGSIFCCWCMRKAKERWPQLGPAGLIGISFGVALVFDVVVEIPWLRMGLYSYPGSIDWLTLFHGHYYQYPIYEAFLIAAWLTGFACCRYFKNDKGQTLAERGIDELRVKGARRTGLRLLALTGIINTSFMLMYSLPSAIIGLYNSPWPEDVTSRSYFMNGAYCGPDKQQACSGPGVPVPRRDSAHLSPDGRLIVPEGTRLPSQE